MVDRHRSVELVQSNRVRFNTSLKSFRSSLTVISTTGFSGKAVAGGMTKLVICSRYRRLVELVVLDAS